MPIEKPKRAALYIRVSTDEQVRHGLSLADQRTSLEEYAALHDFDIVGVYEDAGISARKPYKKRPSLLRLLDDCKEGKIDIILFIKLDRWFRNVGNYYAVQDLLDTYHVAWRATQEDYETVTASGRLKVNIMLSVAQDEADRASERIKFVFDGKRARREALTGNTPTGYKLEGKRLVKDPATEEAVYAFLHKYLACGSVSVAQQCALDHGMRIEYQLASKILRSPVYYGHYYGVDGMAPSYITKEEFDRICSMREKVVRKVTKNRVYLFSGIIVCGECGFHLAGRSPARNRNPQYNCPGHYIKRSGCENKTNLSEAKIEAFILDNIESGLASAEAGFRSLVDVREVKSYKNEIASAKAKLAKLKELFINDLISMDEYRKDREDLLGKISYYEDLEKPIAVPDFSKLENALYSGWRADYAILSRQEKREFWYILLKEIRLYPDRHVEFDLNL